MTQAVTGRIPGARTIDMQKIVEGFNGVPVDGEVVVYCACPNEATAVRWRSRCASWATTHPAVAGWDHAWIDAGPASSTGSLTVLLRLRGDSFAVMRSPALIRSAPREKHEQGRHRDHQRAAASDRIRKRCVPAARCYLSGQIGLDPVTGNLREGVDARPSRSSRILERSEAAGGSFDDIVKVTLLLADMADFTTVNEILANSFAPPYPARATYQVAALPGVRASRSKAC